MRGEVRQEHDHGDCLGHERDHNRSSMTVLLEAEQPPMLADEQCSGVIPGERTRRPEARGRKSVGLRSPRLSCGETGCRNRIQLGGSQEWGASDLVKTPQKVTIQG